MKQANVLFCEVDILRTPSSSLSGLNKGQTWDEDEDAGAPPGPSFWPHSSSGLPTRQAEAGGFGPLLGPFRRNEFRPVMDTSDGKRRDSEEHQSYSSSSFGSLASKKTDF